MPSRINPYPMPGVSVTPRIQTVAPMTERQRLALVMQLASQNTTPNRPRPYASYGRHSRHQRNKRGETPLHVAAILGDHQLVRTLIEQGHDPDLPDFAGWTPLHEACSYGWCKVVEVLVYNGADVNVKGVDDDTPLHDATTAGDLQMVKFLIEHGADPFAKNTRGKLPVDYASLNIFSYLNSLSDINMRASHGGRGSDDGNRRGYNANAQGESSRRRGLDTSTQNRDTRDEGLQLSSAVVSSTQDETVPIPEVNQRYAEGTQASGTAEEEAPKRKKRKEQESFEPIWGPPPTLPPVSVWGKQAWFMLDVKAPDSGINTGAGYAGLSGFGSFSGTGAQQSHWDGSGSSTFLQGASGSQSCRAEKANRKPMVFGEEQPGMGATELKVPPLKIVMPSGGLSGIGDQEEGAEGGDGPTLPYVLPCFSADFGQITDSSDDELDETKEKMKNEKN